MKTTSTIKRNWFGIVFSLTIILVVFLNLDLDQVRMTFAHLDWNFLILAFGVFLVNYFLRTLRFRALLQLESVPFVRLFGLTSLYGMYLYLLPARSGEISFPVMFKKNLGIEIVQGTASLIVARIFDFWTVVVLLPLVAIPFWQEIIPSLRWGIVLFVGLVSIGSGLGLWAIRKSQKWKAWLEPSDQKIGRIKTLAAQLLQYLSAIEDYANPAQLVLLTLGIWICVLLNFYLVLLALGYSLTIFQIMVFTVIMVPLSLFPIQGFANIGTHEAGWVFAFSLFDYSEGTALNIAISTHILIFFLVLALGAIGYLCQAKGANEKI